MTVIKKVKRSGETVSNVDSAYRAPDDSQIRTSIRFHMNSDCRIATPSLHEKKTRLIYY